MEYKGIFTVLRSQKLWLLATCDMPEEPADKAPREGLTSKNDGGQDDITVVFEMWSTNWRREKGIERSKGVMMKVIYSKDGYFKRDYPKTTLQIRFYTRILLGLGSSILHVQYESD